MDAPDLAIHEGPAGDLCTITSSNLEEIGAGSKVISADAAGDGSLDTDVVLDAVLATLRPLVVLLRPTRAW
jgi:hypothetical protein